MPGIIFPSGSTCEIYSFGYTFGCTDDAGITRDITQQWFFDEELQTWVSVSVDDKFLDYDSFLLTSPAHSEFLDIVNGSPTQSIKFSTSVQYVASKITFEKPPPAGKYAELKLLIENAPIGFSSNYLSFAGRDISGSISSVHLDPDINLSGTTHNKQYSYTVWTKDGGENYFVHSNGSTYGWDIS